MKLRELGRFAGFLDDGTVRCAYTIGVVYCAELSPHLSRATCHLFIGLLPAFGRFVTALLLLYRIWQAARAKTNMLG